MASNQGGDGSGREIIFTQTDGQHFTIPITRCEGKYPYPSRPRSCNVKSFWRSLEVDELGTIRPSHQRWDRGLVYSPSWGDLSRDPSRIGQKSMYAVPRLQAMLLFFTRRVRRFEIPRNYKFSSDAELWTRFPEAMREITGLSGRPREKTVQPDWDTQRSVRSRDSALDPYFLIPEFQKFDTEPPYLLAFFRRYHKFFEPRYDPLNDFVMWILFPRMLSLEASEEGHNRIYYSPQPRPMSPAEQLEAVREELYDEAASEIPRNSLPRHTFRCGDEGPREISYDAYNLVFEHNPNKGSIFPFGTTFLAKKERYDSHDPSASPPRPWKHQSMQIEKVLRYLEMRVRTTGTPPAYDGVRDQFLWDKYPSGMSYITGLQSAPSNTVYYEWPARDFLSQDRAPLFSSQAQALDTREALEYVAHSCRQYFRVHAARFGAEETNYDPNLDLYIYKLLPRASREHVIPVGGTNDIRLTAIPTCSHTTERLLRIHPAVTAEHRRGNRACPEEEVEIFDGCAPTRQQKSLSLRLESLFTKVHGIFRRYERPYGYMIERDLKLWTAYREEMVMVTGLDPPEGTDLFHKWWSFKNGIHDDKPIPLFDKMAIDNSDTFRFWKDYFSRKFAQSYTTLYNPEQDAFLWSLFPEGAREYYEQLDPPLNTRANWAGINAGVLNRSYPARYALNAVEGRWSNANDPWLKSRINRKRKLDQLYDDDATTTASDDDDFIPDASDASDTSESDGEGDSLDSDSLDDSLEDEVQYITNDDGADLHFLEEQFFWDSWVNRLKEADVPCSYNGAKDLYMWGQFPKLMAEVCFTNPTADFFNLEWPHPLPPGPGPLVDQNILPYNSLDTDIHLQHRLNWLARTSESSPTNDRFLKLFFPKSMQQRSAQASFNPTNLPISTSTNSNIAGSLQENRPETAESRRNKMADDEGRRDFPSSRKMSEEDRKIVTGFFRKILEADSANCLESLLERVCDSARMISAHIPSHYPAKAKFFITKRINDDMQSASSLQDMKPTFPQLGYYKRVTSSAETEAAVPDDRPAELKVTEWASKLSRIDYEAFSAHVRYLKSITNEDKMQLPTGRDGDIINLAISQYNLINDITEGNVDRLLQAEGLDPHDMSLGELHNPDIAGPAASRG